MDMHRRRWIQWVERVRPTHPIGVTTTPRAVALCQRVRDAARTVAAQGAGACLVRITRADWARVTSELYGPPITDDLFFTVHTVLGPVEIYALAGGGALALVIDPTTLLPAPPQSGAGEMPSVPPPGPTREDDEGEWR